MKLSRVCTFEPNMGNADQRSFMSAHKPALRNWHSRWRCRVQVKQTTNLMSSPQKLKTLNLKRHVSRFCKQAGCCEAHLLTFRQKAAGKQTATTQAEAQVAPHGVELHAMTGLCHLLVLLSTCSSPVARHFAPFQVPHQTWTQHQPQTVPLLFTCLHD